MGRDVEVEPISNEFDWTTASRFNLMAYSWSCLSRQKKFLFYWIVFDLEICIFSFSP